MMIVPSYSSANFLIISTHYKDPNEEVSIQKESREQRAESREKKKKKKLRRMGGAGGVAVVVVILILSEWTRGGNAAQHVVGGSQGWDVSADLTTWASSHTFKVGDQLEFKYTVGLHSVVELGSESEYKNCNIGNAVTTMNGGKDMVKLSKVGTRYFVCGTPGHCAQGMKLKVNTLAASVASANTTDSSSSSSSSSTLKSYYVYLVLTMLLVVSITINFSSYSK
ncbi:blue copper protein [Telopea speciosissima]|uniref:blue copper protein n=1 Tax=Telopea speciosissima TaxID=54955 RepID=UPI001CC79452|nr:blue copper protein [Telopea speciosissima]